MDLKFTPQKSRTHILQYQTCEFLGGFMSEGVFGQVYSRNSWVPDNSLTKGLLPRTTQSGSQTDKAWFCKLAATKLQHELHQYCSEISSSRWCVAGVPLAPQPKVTMACRTGQHSCKMFLKQRSKRCTTLKRTKHSIAQERARKAREKAQIPAQLRPRSNSIKSTPIPP